MEKEAQATAPATADTASPPEVISPDVDHIMTHVTADMVQDILDANQEE